MAVWTISQGLTEKEYGILAHVWCKPDAKDERIIEDEIHHCLNFGLPRLTTKLLSDNLTNVFLPFRIILYILTRISYSYCQLSCSWNPPLNISPLQRVWWWFQGRKGPKIMLIFTALFTLSNQIQILSSCIPLYKAESLVFTLSISSWRKVGIPQWRLRILKSDKSMILWLQKIVLCMLCAVRMAAIRSPALHTFLIRAHFRSTHSFPTHKQKHTNTPTQTIVMPGPIR